MASFYDLVAIEFFNLLNPGAWAREMAFSVGEHNISERVTRRAWELFAVDLGMPPKQVLIQLEELATEL